MERGRRWEKEIRAIRKIKNWGRGIIKKRVREIKTVGTWKKKKRGRRSLKIRGREKENIKIRRGKNKKIIRIWIRVIEIIRRRGKIGKIEIRGRRKIKIRIE